MLILDTDIARAFAKAGHFDALIQLFGKVGITPMVYEELQVPLMHGYTYPDEIFNKAELVTISGDEQRDYLKLMDEHSKIGKGEIESMVVCRKRGFLFSSFDKKAIFVAKESGVKVMVTGAIFKGFMLKGVATKEEVLKILQDIETSDNRSFEIEL